MKNVLSILVLFSVILFAGCSSNDSEYIPPLSGGNEETDPAKCLYKYVVVNGVENDLHLIKHVQTNKEPIVEIVETLKFGEASELKGSNQNSVVIVFRWKGKEYPGHEYFETVEPVFSDGYFGRQVNVTLVDNIFNVEIISTEK